MQSINSIALRATALTVAVAALAGCANTSSMRAADRSPTWTKQMVAGSRIARRIDAFGNPDTGTLVQVITDENLKNMPGQTLGDKLSGNPGGL